MAASPIITFKAGQCELIADEGKPWKVKPQEARGYISLYSEDDLLHFCWRLRNTPLDEAEVDLVMVPGDVNFVPYDKSEPSAKTNGRIFVLKFGGSPERYLFWLQSKPQMEDPSALSPRDRQIGDIVNSLLQGDDINVQSALDDIRADGPRRPDDDDDEDMEDADAHADRSRQHPSRGSGGAGADATGGDVRDEGEESREGGSDGARAASSGAPPDASEAVRNLLASLQGQPGLSGSGGQSQGQMQDKPYPHLSHLLPTSITVPMVDAIATNDPSRLDALMTFLPRSVIVLSGPNPGAFNGKDEPSAAAVEEASASLSLEAKKSLLKKVLRSPQFHQALGVLTQALRDGGLPGVADALGITVENGGYLQNGSMPLGGGLAIEAFVEGVRKTVREQKQA